MIIVYLQGGLGNQLFQYAAGLSLGENPIIYFDLSFLKQNANSNENFQARGFELATFKKIKYRIINPFLLKILFSKNQKLNLFKKTIFGGLGKLQYINEDNIFAAVGNRYSAYLHGYFQNPHIFERKRKELIHNLQFPEVPSHIKAIEKQIQLTNSVSVHIRRGDYLNKETIDYHGVLPISYYRSAVEEILTRVKNPIFYIFSDDVNWCKKELQFIKHQIIVSEPCAANWIDMYLMSICNHHIIANSSFSWWGAWLNKKEDKIIIAPQNWYVDRENEIIPKGWILI